MRSMWTAYLGYHMWGEAEFAFRPAETIKRVQDRRVQKIVTHAYNTVPYYRETMDRLGVRPADFANVYDLAQLPILEREQLQEDPQYFVSRSKPIGSYLELRSGGSTGAPVTVYHDTPSLLQNAAHGERERAVITSLAGERFGYRELGVVSPLSSTVKVQQLYLERTLVPRKMRVNRRYASLLDDPGNVARLVESFRPVVMRSYGSFCEMFLAHVEEAEDVFEWPRVVVYSSDGMSEAARTALQSRYRVAVLSTYGAIEAFKIGYECEHHTGLHINIDLCPVRIVNSNGQGLPADEFGDVVVSNLVNSATVLLNYRLGDIASILSKPCLCGRSLPLLSFIQGRSDDWVRLASGKMVHPQAIKTIFTNENHIYQYQVVQVADTRFQILLRPAIACPRQVTERRIAANLRQLLGSDVEVEITFVNRIDRTGAGKLRTVVAGRRLCNGTSTGRKAVKGHLDH